jgi:nucleoid DNA-binding protein
MNKQEFIDHIARQHGCTKKESEKAIDIFTSSVIDALGKGKEISLIGFGSFSVQKVEAREGRNPRTGDALKIAAYNQLKFKVGQKLKDTVNKKSR